MQTTNRSYIAPKNTICRQICIIIKISISSMEMATTWASCQISPHSKKCHRPQVLYMMNKISNLTWYPESHLLRRNTANSVAYTTQTISIQDRYRLIQCRINQRVSIPVMALVTVRIITWTIESNPNFTLSTARILWLETRTSRELSLDSGKLGSMPWIATQTWEQEIAVKLVNLELIRQTLVWNNRNK